MGIQDVKVACNVAKPIGDKGNQLSELLRSWLGKQAGLPGTDFRVLFELRDGQWNVCPIGASSDTQESREEEEIAAPDEVLVGHEISERLGLPKSLAALE